MSTNTFMLTVTLLVLLAGSQFLAEPAAEPRLAGVARHVGSSRHAP